MWTEPIYDRAQDDITNRTAKAFFNVADWVRINGNTEAVNALVNVMFGLGISFEALPEPSIATIPTIDDINAFIANIERVRAGAMVPVATGVVALRNDYRAGTSADAPDYVAVNAWERDLHLIRECLRSASEQMIFCGVASCGQSHLWQVRFRKWSYAPEAYDARRLGRCGIAVAGAGLTRQNKWRSPIDDRRRYIRTGLAITGAGLTRQNGFRRYA